jgi:hypothetical protein
MYLIVGNEGFSMTDCFQLAIATKREGKKRAFTQVFFLLGRLDQGGLENPPLTTAKQKEKMKIPYFYGNTQTHHSFFNIRILPFCSAFPLTCSYDQTY